MKEILIEVKNLKRHFRLSNQETVHAVDGVSFAIRKGEIIGLVGESGCGKTTTGRLILRLIEPDEGEILYEKENILSFSFREMMSLRRKMQIIFQDPFSSLDPRKSVENLIAQPLKIHNFGNKKKIKERTIFLMDKVGLTREMSTKYTHELDGGRCQRIGIARALALDPVFIVCDEPVSALDVSIQAQILNLIEGLSKELKLTYLFISHDLSVVRRLSHRIMVMYLGLIVEFASSKELFDNPFHPYSKALLSAVPSLKLSKQRKRIILKGDVPTPINVGSGCRFFPRCDQALSICSHVDPLSKEIKPNHYVACHLYS
ncbi:MAG: ABC transporter ATP-binding protein [Candidatus Bathyarchaeota archaeon]|nr:ABC transporter ATP-binding protein [Candidatus Bathyarchaeota archaeon]